MSLFDKIKSFVGIGDEIYLSKSEVLSIVDSSFVYPRKKTLQKELKDNETTIVECCYTCNESDCDFNKAIKQIENSGELKGLGVKLITESVVKTIAENPKVFPSCGLGGYIIQYSGRPYLILKNNTINFKQNDDCRYGLLERDEIMKSVLSEGKRQQDIVRGSFVVLFTVYLSYLLKKMKWSH